MILFSPGPLGPFRILTKSCGDICNFEFIAGGVDTDEKLFTKVNKFIASNNANSVKQLQEYQLAYTSK